MKICKAIAVLAFSVGAAHAQSGEEIDYAVGLLGPLNVMSFEVNREVCGYVIREPDGSYDTTKLNWGTEASCSLPPTGPHLDVVASWHTHGAYVATYDSEVPSTLDVESDMRNRVNGWVATPGGRLWFVNGETGDIYQVCGRGCLPSDPNFRPETRRPVAKHYSLPALRTRFGE